MLVGDIYGGMDYTKVCDGDASFLFSRLIFPSSVCLLQCDFSNCFRLVFHQLLLLLALARQFLTIRRLKITTPKMLLGPS